MHNRIYSLSNLVGLTIALLVFMLISSLVVDELSFDRQWSNSNELYRMRIVPKETKEGVTNNISGAPEGIIFTKINNKQALKAVYRNQYAGNRQRFFQSF